MDPTTQGALIRAADKVAHAASAATERAIDAARLAWTAFYSGRGTLADAQAAQTIAERADAEEGRLWQTAHRLRRGL